MLKDLILRNRSYRRFDESQKVDISTLKELIELARLTSSASNQQPLRYILANDAALNAQIFGCLAWAGFLRDWTGPAEGERPTAYVVILRDNNIRSTVLGDDGIVAQTIMLGATEKGFGGCILGAINKKKLRDVLNIAENLDVLFVLALGKPNEKVVLEVAQGDDTKYWRDENGVHHVPKRSLDEVLVRVN